MQPGQVVEGDNPEEVKKQKAIKGFLNKITPEKFDKILADIIAVGYETQKTEFGLVNQVTSFFLPPHSNPLSSLLNAHNLHMASSTVFYSCTVCMPHATPSLSFPSSIQQVFMHDSVCLWPTEQLLVCGATSPYSHDAMTGDVKDL